MTDSRPSIYALILAGGAGTRFWPASRSARPKQLLPLVSDDPLILETARRVLPLCGSYEHLLVASGRHLVEATAAILPELPFHNLLVEPTPRNTAPAIGWAAARVARTDPDAVLMVLPSDHHIADVPGFQATLERAIASARTGAITTIGITPTHPETGYGYIEMGDAHAGGGLTVKRFVEKPHRALAEELLATGRYLWNGGMFFFRARDMISAIRAHQPELAAGLDAFDRAAAAGDELTEVLRTFPTLPSVSIDKGVMEHMTSLAVLPGDFGWSDIGSWQSAWELATKDGLGNASPEGALFIDSRNNQVVDLRKGGHGKHRVIALVGVEDLVVVETDDALLIVPRGRSQDVKEIVDALKKRGDTHLV